VQRTWRLGVLTSAAIISAVGADIVTGPVHLRSGAEREWNEFPAGSAPPSLNHTFESRVNASGYTLAIRQRDVKNPTWTVALNGRVLGVLASDERDMRTYLPVPAGTLRDGPNLLSVSLRSATTSDDIELRDIRMYAIGRDQFLRDATLTVDTGANTPARITVVDAAGVLVPFAAMGDSQREAVRTGVVYAANGRTEIGLPAGGYIVYASRGWAYSAPSARVTLRSKARRTVRLPVTREVNLRGYIDCDTHVHTLELSGHGDAGVRERIITAAGEGLDAIVATEHDKISDYSEWVRKLRLERLIRVIPGSEVTTQLGHFNVFPLAPGAQSPANRPKDWATLSQSVRALDGAKVIIQNHPRDLHLNYRPFDPAHHLSSAGENLNGRPVFANAMEVINSGAMYSDMLQLVRDWLGLLNAGLRVAAIGASDTHTVDFVPIGQARTVIHAATADDAAERLGAGDNLVTYGLAATLRVESVKPLVAAVEIHGPSWTSADQLTIYANGIPAAEEDVPASRAAGRKWAKKIKIETRANDLMLVAVASGPGVLRPFWEVRKPYQPVSKDWIPRVMGISRAVPVDVDGNGFQSPRDYAATLLRGNDLSRLNAYDESVSVQVLSLAALHGQNPESLRDLVPVRAYDIFMADWKLSRRTSTN
jgi:hypothetical protein